MGNNDNSKTSKDYKLFAEIDSYYTRCWISFWEGFMFNLNMVLKQYQIVGRAAEVSGGLAISAVYRKDLFVFYA